MSTCTVESKREDVLADPNSWAIIVHPKFPISPPSAHYFPEDKVPLLLQFLDAKEVRDIYVSVLKIPQDN